MAKIEIGRVNGLNSSGRGIIVVVFQHINSYKALAGVEKTKGRLEYQLTNGDEVEKIGDDKYRIVATGEVFWGRIMG